MMTCSPSQMDLPHHLDLPSVSDSSDTEDFLQELAALNDVGLLRATMESLECGRLTPLIKEELRCRIQSRRLSEGKEELLVDFPSPTPSQPRPDEVEKRDRRREQNRRAAQKFRKKKRERGDHLMEETQRLECHNTSLRSEIKQLHEEREHLTRIIQSHASICPLTPRQSPLTIPRESPLPTFIRESPLTLSTFTGNIVSKSPVMGKSPMVIQSPVLLVPPTRESPVPLLIINSARESPVTTSLIPSSPVPMTSRSRKSPVTLIRINQSPAPGDKILDRGPVPFGSPPKQSKHFIPPRLNLAGPKPVPILPKPAPTNSQSSPLPQTPKGIITSPLSFAPSPGSGGRLIHASPVFFREGCFTPSGHGRQINQSPISVCDSSSSSTPGRIAQQSPVFFGERAPSSGQASSQFLQPSSASSGSSSSSLASLLRQESPLSMLSNSSSSSSASSLFIGSTTSPNMNSNSIVGNSANVSNNSTSNSYDIDNSSSFPYTMPYSSIRENPEDNVLSLEEIEKSASAFEARDDLNDFMDIQALLELSSDHVLSKVGACGQANLDNHSTHHRRSSEEDMGIRYSAQIVPKSDMSSLKLINSPSPLQHHGPEFCVSTLTHNFNKLSGSNIAQNLARVDSSTVGQESCFDIDAGICHHPSAFRQHNNDHFQAQFHDPKTTHFTDTGGVSDKLIFQNVRKSQPLNSNCATSVQQFHKQLLELISRRRLAESNITGVGDDVNNTRHCNGDTLLQDNSCYLQTEDDIPSCSADSSDGDLTNIHSSLPVDMLITSASGPGMDGDSVIS